MANKIDLGGRNAVVTGGAQGIGRAIVERLSASGAAVAIWDRDGKLAADAAAELGGSTIAVGCDVTRLTEIEAARDRAPATIAPPARSRATSTPAAGRAPRRRSRGGARR